jgi:hypothetical protein
MILAHLRSYVQPFWEELLTTQPRGKLLYFKTLEGQFDCLTHMTPRSQYRYMCELLRHIVIEQVAGAFEPWPMVCVLRGGFYLRDCPPITTI